MRISNLIFFYTRALLSPSCPPLVAPCPEPEHAAIEFILALSPSHMHTPPHLIRRTPRLLTSTDSLAASPSPNMDSGTPPTPTPPTPTPPEGRHGRGGSAPSKHSKKTHEQVSRAARSRLLGWFNGFVPVFDCVSASPMCVGLPWHRPPTRPPSGGAGTPALPLNINESAR